MGNLVPTHFASPWSIRSQRRFVRIRRDAIFLLTRVGSALTQGACVAVAPDGDDCVDLLHLEAVDLGDEGQLLLGRLAHGDHVDSLDLDPGARIGAGPQRLPVKLPHERRRDGPAVEPHDLTGLELQRVVDDEVGQLRHARIGHVDSYIASGGT